MRQDSVSTAKPRTVSLGEAARLLGKHRNTVAGWLAQGAPSVAAARRAQGVEWQLDLGALLDWHVERAAADERARCDERHAAEVERLHRALEGAGTEGEPVSRSEALRRKAVAEARLAELDVGERERDLISRDLHQQALYTCVSVIRDRFLGLHARLAQDLAAATTPAACADIVETEVHRVMNDVARFGADLEARILAGDDCDDVLRPRPS